MLAPRRDAPRSETLKPIKTRVILERNRGTPQGPIENRALDSLAAHIKAKVIQRHFAIFSLVVSLIYSYLSCVAVAKYAMSISSADTGSSCLTRRSPATANTVNSARVTRRAASLQDALKPAGNTANGRSNTPPTSTVSVLHARRLRGTNSYATEFSTYLYY
ncbi:hypothetical protein LshimejAT787_0212270 [Lyophyllum shimeji]|uniref:Uncharacterized protein n=1 Tax=Lyophyllum shimeji TaxID=47721 RepID=A0A9P3PGK0_LYOSH|nr:hypothetical protein LshimejAT787_0212270 [Lyophyllum shimeji]